MNKLNIGIIGGGPAGMSAAILLAKDPSNHITIFERERIPKPIGAGIMLQPTGLKVFDTIGIGDQIRKLGAPIERFYSENHKGKVVFDLDFFYQGLCGYGINRGVIFEHLQIASQLDNIKLIPNQEIIKIDFETSKLVNSFKQESDKFDLIIVADGRGSLVRNQFSSLIKVAKPQRYAALWSKLPLTSASFDNGINHVYKGTELMLGLMSIGRESVHDDQRMINFFCGVREDFFEDWSQAKFRSWKDEMRRLAPHYEAILDEIKEFDQLTIAQYYDVLLKKQTVRQVAFIGDAAHALSPHLSSGTNLALLDSFVLAESVTQSTTMDESFQRFEKMRRSQIEHYHFISKLISPMFQSYTDLSFVRDNILSKLLKIPYFRKEILQTILGMKAGVFKRLPEHFYK